MAIYSIRDLERLTGIKAHTIRIWEQRYKLVVPHRTETNIRYYTDEELRLLFNIALLNRQGYKISKLAGMPHDKIAGLVSEIAETNNSHNTQIDAITLSMIDMDEASFERIFSAYVWENGFERTMVELIYPFLDKLNILWLTNSISAAHEKFISNLIRRKLMAAIDKEPVDTQDDTHSFVLYTPEGETQELTLLFMQYLLRTRGFKVIYLGANTSLNDIRDISHTLKPSYIFTILQEPLPRQTIQNYVDTASRSVNGSELLLTGAQLFINPVKLPQNAKVLNGLPDTLQFLDNLPA
ncbi:MAG TPA: MerR family transcriptional regulator [Saprospiraceae bacterium]|nr:MerR family transcriptional regulator [Saprospiraceae bacterium]HPI06702.1 MerR family transcriptional regulator [Saprospiraceae bacterium]